MFDYTGGYTRDILKALSEPTYRCGGHSAGIMPVWITAINGAVFVTSEPETQKKVSEEFGVGFDRRQVLIIGDRYFLLDEHTPELDAAAFKRPETKESVKKRAMNKLSKEEREALGL